MVKQPVSVSQLTVYIKSIMENDPKLKSVSVRGEISNYKYHSSGHIYFTLKDENSKIKCVMFKGYTSSLKFKPEDGLNVVITGSISVYERDGQYQMYCYKMEPDGIGELYLAFEQLKSKLSREGIFDDMFKKPIPLLPGRIGVATSPTGAVIKDIINVSTKRFRNINILLYPVKVQGNGAANTIAEAIEYFNSRDDIDVIIIGRGGGSIEELWAFNEEIVARAIHKSRIPVISAVGHETDFTIADFAADVRASTPSHAAEIAVPSYENIKYKIGSVNLKLIKNINVNLTSKRYNIKSALQRIDLNSPKNVIVQNIQYLDNLQNRLLYIIQSKLSENRHILSVCASKIDSFSPIKTLTRGYTYADKNGSVIKSIKSININDEINLHMHDGSAVCRVENIMEGIKWQGKKEN
jgi:exodeoxyribonuclease VII large subunit